MSGSIYYWAINAGAVLRITLGRSATPVNFLGAPNAERRSISAGRIPTSNFLPVVSHGIG